MHPAHTAVGHDDAILDVVFAVGEIPAGEAHALSIVFAIADRAIMLDPVSRSIIADGSPTELRDRSADPRVRQFFNRQADAVSGKE